MNSDFWRVWTAANISAVGNGAIDTALPLLAAMTGAGALAVSGVTVALTMPVLVFGAAAGRLADRVDRRWLLVAVDVARALLLVAAALAVPLSTGVLLAVTAALAASSVVATCAAQSLVPSVVPGGALSRANGLLGSGQAAAEYVLGPLFGAALVEMNYGAPLWVDAATFVASALILAGLRGRHRPPFERAEGRSSGMGAEARRIARTVGFLCGAQTVAQSVQPLYALRVLHVTAARYGLMLAVAAVTAIAAGTAAGRLAQRWGTLGPVPVLAAAAGLGYATMALAPTAVIATLGLALENCSVVVGAALLVSARQEATAPAAFGRAAAYTRIWMCSAGVVGACLGGAVTHVTGPRDAYAVAVVLYAAVVAGPLRRLMTEHRSLAASRPTRLGGVTP